jgi:hypothetical protein
MRYEGQHFSDTRVTLDGNEFDGCRFTNVLFEYAGGPVHLCGCQFEGFGWEFGGDLGRGLSMLGQLYASGPGAAIAQISKAMFPKPATAPGVPPQIPASVAAILAAEERDARGAAASEPERPADPFDYSRLHATIRRAPKLARTAGHC